MDERQQRLDAVAAIAVALAAETKLPARLTVAQWAVESQWGAKPSGHANYFGMKRADRHTKFCLEPTHEVWMQGQINAWNAAHPNNQCRDVQAVADRHGYFRVVIDAEFADYDNLEESCKDYAWLITHGEPYAAARAAFQKSKNFTAFATAVLAKYATASYGALALQIAEQANVTAAIAGVKA